MISHNIQNYSILQYFDKYQGYERVRSNNWSLITMAEFFGNFCYASTTEIREWLLHSTDTRYDGYTTDLVRRGSKVVILNNLLALDERDTIDYINIEIVNLITILDQWDKFFQQKPAYIVIYLDEHGDLALTSVEKESDTYVLDWDLFEHKVD